MITVIAHCDRCGSTSGDYGWTSAAQLRADLREAGWSFPGRASGRGAAICVECKEQEREK